MSTRGAVVGGVLVVLVVGAFVADRVAAGVASREVVSAIEDNLEVTGDPEVSVGGFPFLVQVLRGSVDDIAVRVDSVTFDGVELTDVVLDAEGVGVRSPHRISHAVVTGTLPTATLTRLVSEQVGLDVTMSVSGTELVGTSTVLGLPVAIHLVPRVEAGTIRVEVTSVELASVTISVADLPAGVGQRLRDLAVPVNGLPQGVTVQDVEVVPAGARVTATGSDVELSTAG